MEVLSRTVDFTVGSSSRNRKPYFRKQSLRINGRSLFGKPSRNLPIPLFTTRFKNCSVIAVFKRVGEAPKRRNALRPKILEQQEEVRQPGLKISDNVYKENETLSEENRSGDSGERSSEGVGEDSSEGSAEYFRERLAEDFREGLEEVPEGEIKDALWKLWDGIESLNSRLEKKPRVKNVSELVKTGKARGEKLGEAFGVLVGSVRVPPIVKFSLFGAAFIYGCLCLFAVGKYLFRDVPLEKKALEQEQKKKMLTRKMKARAEKEKMERDLVAGKKKMERDLVAVKDSEVLDWQSSNGMPSAYSGEESVKKVGRVYKGDPNLNEAERQKRILATTSSSKGKLPIDDREFDNKVQEIRSMAREARRIEQQNKSDSSNVGTKEVENMDNPKDSNLVLDSNRIRSASGPDPIDVSLLATTLKTLLDNHIDSGKSAKTTITKDEHSNVENGRLGLKNFSKSIKGESEIVADLKASDGNGLGALASVANAGNKVNADAPSVTVLDYKGDENRISNGETLKAEKMDLKENKITAENTTAKDEHFNVQNSILSEILNSKKLSNSNKLETTNIVDSHATNGKGLGALVFVDDSGIEVNAKELKPLDVSASNATLVEGKDRGNGISNGSMSKETPLDLHKQILSRDSNGAKGKKDFPYRENSVNVEYVNATEHSQLDAFGRNSLTDADERAGAEGTVRGQELLSEDGNVVGQERGAQNGILLHKCDSIYPPSRKRSQRMRPRVITSIKEAQAILASKRGKHTNNVSGDIENNTALNGTNGRTVSSDPFMLSNTVSPLPELSIATDSTTAKQTDSITNGRDANVNYEKFRPAFQKEKVRDLKSRWEGKSCPSTTISIHAEKEEESESDGTDSDESDTDKLQTEPQKGTDEEDDDLDWTKNDALTEIVAKVKANEDAGKEPFDSIDSKDKEIFLQGIKKKIKRETESVDKWVSERLENLDYGKDDIAYDDPPEVFLPRWKDHDKTSKSSFLDKFEEDRKKTIETEREVYPSVEAENSSDTAKPSSSATPSIDSTFGATDIRSLSHNNSSASAKTVITSSGKSSKSVKYLKKKSWKNTKKWSHALQEMYNAERDPQIKGVIKDLGQDLDRWITEEEVEEVSQMLEKSPEEQLKDFKRITARIKSEREKFGDEAVLRKYSEYKSEKEDHLWWMDLPYVLCIELYRSKEDRMMKGIYSLEMAPDLEPKEKRFHVVAFEDRVDAKNFCYLLSSQLENGSAHVIARSPKEIYKEAQAEGFKVTVIKKAQLQLYIDKPFEEVEGIITEIGSEIYYEKILQGNMIDMDSVLEDGFGHRPHRLGPK